jgi:N-acetyltransferase
MSMNTQPAPAFELQPALTGRLVELRPLKAEDWDALYGAASDPLIWEQHPESTRWQPEVFRRYFNGAMESRGAFAVIEPTSRRIIGSSRYCSLKAEESEIEIGWTFLTREFWGGPHNGEMKRLMIDHALKFVERVVFVVGENNMRSQKALEKIGANVWKRVPEESKVIFAITRAEWK